MTASAINGTNFNRYWYGNNNPYKFTDPDGRYVESALDVAFIVADVADISSNGLNWTNGISLAANVVGLALPGATGLGPGTRAIAAGVDAARGADDVAKGGTYVLRNSDDVVVRTGRTNDLARREREHGREHPDTTFEVDRRTDDYATQRGREQVIYDQNPQARAENGGRNKQRPVSERNKRREEYEEAARKVE